MNTFLGIVLTLVFFGGLLLIYSLCRMAAPQNEREQELDDRDQLAYLESWAKEKNRK